MTPKQSLVEFKISVIEGKRSKQSFPHPRAPVVCLHLNNLTTINSFASDETNAMRFNMNLSRIEIMQHKWSTLKLQGWRILFIKYIYSLRESVLVR